MDKSNMDGDNPPNEFIQLESPMGAMDVKKNFLDITALVRSIQRSEGNPDCFLMAEGSCDRTDCAWRKYCLETGKGKKNRIERRPHGKDSDFFRPAEP
ncbi:MAG: hypothetical protein JRD04_01065 [Deltaproteobacteria bacterium]|nr:hypothetical protein [Deltaproteobacteria bacterium]